MLPDFESEGRRRAQQDRVAATTISLSPLRRELSRPDKYCLRYFGNERRPGSHRFHFRQCSWHFFYWLPATTSARGIAGGKVECAEVIGADSD